MNYGNENSFYDHFKELAKTRKRKLMSNTYLVVREDGGYSVRLHDTEVVIHYPDCTVFRTGGWETVTTKDRMNRFSSHSIYSEKGVWFLAPFNDFDSPYPFADGIEVRKRGAHVEVDGEGSDPKHQQRLRKRVNEYAKRYADAMLAGEIPAPSAGDCWACCMVAENGTAPMGGAEHIESHISEGYFVPSILVRMKGELAPIVQDYIGRKWYGETRDAEFAGGIAHEHIKKVVRKFCFRELGMPT